MTSYQDEHARIKFMTGVSLNIIPFTWKALSNF